MSDRELQIVTTSVSCEADKPKESFWKRLLNEAAPDSRGKTVQVKLTPESIMKSTKSLEQIIETVAGLNVNPFLVNSESGRYCAPDGSSIQCSILAVKKYWPTTRAQKGSLAERCELLLTGTRTDKAFFEEMLSSARQMNAQGAGLCLLMACLTSTSGELHGKFREIVLHEVMGCWDTFTCWEHWVGMREEEVRESRDLMADEFKNWIEAWERTAKRMCDIFELIVEPVDSRLELVERYSALRKCSFKTVEAMRRALRDESELALRMSTSLGITLSWTERCQLRIKMIQSVLGTASAAFVSNFEQSTDVFGFNELLERVLTAMGTEVPSGTTPPPPSQKPEQSRENSRPIIKTEPSGQQRSFAFGGKCDNCGTKGHMARGCPQLAKDPKRYERLAELARSRQAAVTPTVPVPEKRVGGFAAGSSCEDPFGIRWVTVKTAKGEVRFGIDSGLDLSLIRRNCALYSKEQSFPTNLSLKSLNGHMTRVNELQFCELQIELPGSRAITASGTMGVWDADLPNGVDGLIGSDIIQRYPTILHAVFPIPESPNHPIKADAAGPLGAEELRELIVRLNLPVMSVEVTSDHPTIRGRGYPTQPCFQEKAEEVIQDLLDREIIKDVTDVNDREYGWVSPAFFVAKNSAELKLRFVVDFRQANTRIKRPMEVLGDGIDSFCLSIPRGMVVFACLDVKDAFYAVPVDEESQKYLKASIRIGPQERIVQFLRGPQGLSTTPMWWRTFVDELCRGLSHHWRINGIVGGYRVYVDDVLIFAVCVEDAQLLLDSLCQLLTALMIPFGKVQPPSAEVELLGCSISEKGWRILPNKLTKLQGLELGSKEDVKSALGLVQYLHSAYPSSNFSHHFNVLNRLTKKNTHFEWGPLEQAAWDFFCKQFDDGHYEFGIEDVKEEEYWILQVDACDRGHATVLWRTSELPLEESNKQIWFADAVERGVCRRVAVRQHSFSDTEIRYPTWDKESLALFTGLFEFQEVLLASLGKNAEGKIVVYSDSTATVGRWRKLLDAGNLEGSLPRLKRWLRWQDDVSEILSTKPRFLSIAGEQNGVADFFSRVLHQSVLKGGFAGVIEAADNNGELSGSSLGTFDFSCFQREILELQKTTDEKYQKHYLRELRQDIPESLLSFSVETELLHFMNRLYVPDGLIELGGRTVHARTFLIHLCHDQVHPGVTRVMSLLGKYWWPRMQADVTMYIKTCHSCQVQRARQVHGRITGRHIADRFNVIVVDHCKPKTPGKHGYNYCLVISDLFTRYVRIYPCRSLASQEFVDAYLDWCLSFGFPRKVICDNHSTFQAEIWKAVLKWPKDQTAVLNPPTFYPLPQGIAERHMEVIKASIVDAASDWPDRVRFLAFAHNLCPLQSSSVCPFELVLGTKPQSLVDLLTWTSNPNPDFTSEEVFSKLQEELEVARQYQSDRVTQLRQYGRDRYNENHSDLGNWEGPVLYVTLGPLGRSVSGPFEIVGRENNMFDIRISDSETRRVALSQVVAYHSPSDAGVLDRRNLVVSSTSFDWGSLIKIKPRDLKKGDMVLARRVGSTPINDEEAGVISLDLCKVVSVAEDLRLIECEVFASSEVGKWKTTKIKKGVSFGDVVVSGFTLTKGKYVRAKDRKIWVELGLYY